MEIEGMIIRELGLVEGVSKAGNPWKKREWVLETTGQYPRKVKFHVFGDRSDTFNLELGKSYIFSVDLESREFNDRWYTDVSAYSYRPSETGAGAQPANPSFAQPAHQQQASSPAINTATFDTDLSSGGSDEDLPF